MTTLPIIQKPPFRAPCNRCGECCKAGPCTHACEMLRADENEMCPALEIESDGKFSCGLYKRPFHYIKPEWAEHDQTERFLADLIASTLGFGQGCGMEDDPEERG